MTMGFRARSGLSAALLLTGAFSWASAEAPQKVEKRCLSQASKAIQTIYQVTDLFVCPNTTPIPQPREWTKTDSSATTGEAQLIRLITQSIEPSSWSGMGGSGTIDYFPIGQSLVIVQKPEVQERIADLLQALRRTQDLEVATEIRFISLPDSVMQDLDLCGVTQAKPSRPHCLNDSGLLRLMEAVAACDTSHIMQAPKMVLYNGEDGRLDILEEQVVPVAERVGGEPQCEVVKLGWRLAAQPVVSADRRFVSVHLMAEERQLASRTPVSINVQRINQSVTIPNGCTAILYGWRNKARPVEKGGMPVLRYIPYFTELVAAANAPPEDENVLIAVTPRILVFDEAEEHAVVPPVCLPRKTEVADQLAKYRQACAEGRLAEARGFAKRALNLDPTCFCDSCPR